MVKPGVFVELPSLQSNTVMSFEKPLIDIKRRLSPLSALAKARTEGPRWELIDSLFEILLRQKPDRTSVTTMPSSSLQAMSWSDAKQKPVVACAWICQCSCIPSGCLGVIVILPVAHSG